LITLLWMSGCAVGNETKPPEVVTRTKVVDTACQWVKPIYPSAADVLTDGTAKQIVDHNETGEKRCGWKPKGS
jgi:hypothetical protein